MSDRPPDRRGAAATPEEPGPSVESRCYVYGLPGDPVQGVPIVDQQIAGAHRYRNQLVEIERDRRAAVREVLGQFADTGGAERRLAEIDVAARGVAQEITLARSSTRSRSEGAALRARLRDLRAEAKTLRAEIRAAKTAVRASPETIAALAAVEERAHARSLAARAACGVYWGTYLLVEDDAQRARKSPTPPEFVRWHDTGRWQATDQDPVWLADGRVSVQVQGGISVDDLMTGADTRVRVAPVPPAAWMPETPRGERRRLCRTTLYLRVASDGRAPVWAAWPMIMHRPLPVGAVIKRVTVSRVALDCRRWRWAMQFTIDAPTTSLHRARGHGVCAINLGWRATDRGMRVAYIVGDDGYHKEVVLPPDVPKRLTDAAGIRSVRDKRLDTMRADLTAWLGQQAEIPPWLVERASHVGQWRSPDRFRGLAMAWRNRRFPGDAVGYELIEAWRYRDEHLSRYENGVVRGAIGRRREEYRRLAADLVRRYDHVVVEGTDYSELQRSPAVESERVEVRAVKWQQRAAAPSQLRLALASAFGPRLVKVASDGITATCFLCGHAETWNHATTIDHTCGTCGSVWDQDMNAARNLLQRGIERLRAVAGGDAVRAFKPRESAWSRRKREKAEKAAECCRRGARNGVSKHA